MKTSLHYRCARDKDGNILDVTKLTVRPHAVSCLGCGRAMVTRMGAIRAWHFAHKSIGQCSPETYRHILAKNLFHLKFREAVRDGTSFFVEMLHPVHCHLRPSFPDCENPFDPCVGRWDLTRHFNDVKMEEREGAFVWDLLLFHSQHPNRKLPVEMRVTHECSPEKKAASRIIEINVFDESVVDAFDGFCIPTGTFTAYNIEPNPVVRQLDCRCLALKLARERQEEQRQEAAARRLIFEEQLRQREAYQREKLFLLHERERKPRQKQKMSDVHIVLQLQAFPYARYELRNVGVPTANAGTWQLYQSGRHTRRQPVQIEQVTACLDLSNDDCFYFDNERGLRIRRFRREWKPYVVETRDGRMQCFRRLAEAISSYKKMADAMDG